MAAAPSEFWPFSCNPGICPSLREEEAREDDGTVLRGAGTLQRLVVRLTGAGMLVISGKL